MQRFFLLLCALASWGARAGDQPQWGRAWTRNMVSSETSLPDSFDVNTGKNIKWTARLGTESYATPIVAGGRVYIGTNNEEPRDPKHKSDSGVLMCFDEASGKFLWQLVVPKREEDPYHDWPKTGMPGPVTVDGDRVYLVSNRGEVMCLDALGMANGNDGPYRDEAAHMIPRGTNGALLQTPVPPGPQDADILWLFDLTKGAGIWSHDGAHSSILIRGNYLYVNTSTGVDNTHKRIRTPDAPSLVVIDKRTGKFLARDNEHIAPDIFHCTWCSPSMADVNGRDEIFFGAGNGWLFAFEPAKETENPDGVASLKKIWWLDFDPTAPKENVHSFLSNRREGPSDFYGMPVFDKDRIYIAGGGDLWWGKNEAWLKCIDATGAGNVTSNAVIWSYPLEKHVLSTAAVYNGLVFIADCGRKMHCVDAASGKPCWTDDVTGDVWASPMVADGKVFIGTRSGEFRIYAASRDKKLLSVTQLDSAIAGTATPANGTLFISTMTRLYAVRKE